MQKIEKLKIKADQNDIEAIFKLGEIYANGENVNKDIKKSISYYQKAAAKGHKGAQVILGSI